MNVVAAECTKRALDYSRWPLALKNKYPLSQSQVLAESHKTYFGTSEIPLNTSIKAKYLHTCGKNYPMWDAKRIALPWCSTTLAFDTSHNTGWIQEPSIRVTVTDHNHLPNTAQLNAALHRRLDNMACMIWGAKPRGKAGM